MVTTLMILQAVITLMSADLDQRLNSFNTATINLVPVMHNLSSKLYRVFSMKNLKLFEPCFRTVQTKETSTCLFKPVHQFSTLTS